jgi:hypothetical protein
VARLGQQVLPGAVDRVGIDQVGGQGVDGLDDHVGLLDRDLGVGERDVDRGVRGGQTRRQPGGSVGDRPGGAGLVGQPARR